MKALSIVSPGGARIAAGRKTVETRRWRPNLDPTEDLLIVENHRRLLQDNEEDLNGRAVAIVRVARVRPLLPEDMAAVGGGPYEEGWLAWELVDVRPVQSGNPIVAARGIYEVELPADLTADLTREGRSW
jgi:hypothetical protein